jgi:hypothetical protein
MRRTLRAAYVIALIAAVAWLVIPNVLLARSRSRQKRTLADMRTIATAWEARATDFNTYFFGRNHGPRFTIEEMAAALEPTYVRHMPRTDGWETEFQFTASEDGYIIRSLGSDARIDRIPTIASGATTDFADDVIYSNGSFIRYPEGIL